MPKRGLTLRGRLALGVGALTLLSLLMAGGSLVALRRIRRSLEHTVQRVDRHLLTRSAQTADAVATRRTLDALIKAADPNGVDRALGLLDDRLAPSGDPLGEALTGLAATKRRHLAVTAALSEATAAVDRGLATIMGLLDTHSRTITATSLKAMEQATTAVHDQAVSEARDNQVELQGIARDVDEAITAVRTVYAIRSLSYEMSLLVQRVRNATDPALITYSRKQFATLLENLHTELAALERHTEIGSLGELTDSLGRRVPPFLEARARLLKQGGGVDVSPTEERAILTALRELGATVADRVDDIYFDAAMGLETTLTEREAASAAGIRRLSETYDDMDRTLDQTLTLLRKALEARSDMLALGMTAKEMLLCGEVDRLDTFRDRLTGLFARVTAQVAVLDLPAGDGDVPTLLADLRSQTLSLVDAQGNACRVGRDLAVQAADVRQTIEAADLALSHEADRLQQDTAEQFADTVTVMRRWRGALAGASAVLLGIACVVGWRLARSITRPVHTVLEHLDRVAQGDLSRVVELDRTDEFGLLAHHVNQSVTALRQLLGRAQGIADRVAEAGGDLGRNSAEQLEGITRQSSTLVQTSTSALTLSQGSDQIGQDIRLVSEATDSVRAGMEHIRQTTHTTSQMLHDLQTKSAHIRHVMTLINDVADQTNLLAVNAAIEAARAGEQGRGFAVVADQISKLADSTARSVKDITDIVDQIQEAMTQLVGAMDRSLQEVEQEMHRADDAADKSREIAVNVDAQNVGTRQIASAMTEVSHTMAGVVTRAEHSAQAAVDLNTLADELHQAMSQFKVQTDR